MRTRSLDKHTMNIAFLLHAFPLVSETFVTRQIIDLLELGHAADIYSMKRPPADSPMHPDVVKLDLCARTIYVDASLPSLSVDYEMPVRPLRGDTWLPGQAEPVRNLRRAVGAVPPFLCSFVTERSAALHVLDSRRYGHEAESLSALYRLDHLRRLNRRYDVVHAHFGPTANSFLFTRDLWRAPLVVSFHGYDFTSYPNERGRSVYAGLFETVDAVTVHSSYARARLVQLGCRPEIIHHLPCAVDLADFPYRPRSKEPNAPVRLVTVARLVEKKGVDVALHALGRLRHDSVDFTYDVVGDGPERDRLELLAKDLGIADTVTFHGARDSGFVRSILDRGHVFVLPSITARNGDQEGTPVSLLEAQAAGMPVVSTSYSGIPEIVIDGESGFLIAEHDSVALAQRLMWLAEHPDAWPSIGAAGRRFVADHHDNVKLANRLADIYAAAQQHHGETSRSGRWCQPFFSATKR